MKQVYLDNAATTPVDPTVFAAMRPYFTKKFGNSSEPHDLGTTAKQATEVSRQKIAKFLGCKSTEIIFTGSATESINLAIKGFIESIPNPPHIITSQIEHKAVLETCRHLESLGLATVTYLPVDKYGLVSVAEIEKAITPQTTLISLMYVNNEIGTIQPIPEIGRLIKKINNERRTMNHKPIYFHTDATQGIPHLNCNVDFLGVDFLSFSGHKINAPKGIGVLYKREGTPITRQTDGGAQEMNLRAGTENVPYIVALGKAIELISPQHTTHKLLIPLISQITQIPGVFLTGHPTKRSPHIASFIVEGVEGEALVLYLSNEGVYASSGSACTSNSLQPSHVLTAMGIKPEKAHGSLRLSLGKNTTKDDVEYTMKTLPKVIEKVRRMAPKL